MSQEKTHDLFNFMQQISEEMAAEYDRIRMRATEDPGTAGDQGEENWAELLRGWLPRTYQVVTKGRIISQEGLTSPQLDVLVLKPSYPQKLLNKKLYLAAGVAAAFECKTTLKASHVLETMGKCTKIKSLYPARTGNPYRELHSPVIYGLLAHSHCWKSEGYLDSPIGTIGPRISKAELHIQNKLQEADSLHVTHPRLQLDVLCVADLASWVSSINISSRSPAEGGPASIGPDVSILTYYAGSVGVGGLAHKYFTPIGALVSYVSEILAIEDPSLRDLAIYYKNVGIAGIAGGAARTWPPSILSDEIRLRIETGMLSSKPLDAEWF